MKNIITIINKILFLALMGFLLLSQAKAQTSDLYEVSIKPIYLGVIPQNAVRVPIMQIDVKAHSAILLSEIQLSRTGLSSWEDFGNIWAETKSYRRSLRRQLQADDTVTLNFRRPIKIEKDASETFTIYINLELEGGGKTFQFNVIKIFAEEAKKKDFYKRSKNRRRARSW